MKSKRIHVAVSDDEYNLIISLMDMGYTNTLSQGVRFLMRKGISIFERENNAEKKKARQAEGNGPDSFPG